MTKLAFVAALTLASGALLMAQTQPPTVPGSTPYPYPPGEVPGPMPQGRIPTGSGKKKQKKSDVASQPTISAEGLTTSNNGKTLVVVTQDGRRLTMSVTPQTQFTRSGATITADKIVPRTTVHIDAAEDDEAYLTAVKVDLLKDAPVETPPAAHAASPGKFAASSETNADDEEMAKPTILQNPVDVPDRPVLHHGKPTQSESAAGTDDTKVASSRPAAKPAAQNGETDFTIDDDTPRARPNSPAEALVDKTKAWAMTFTNGLPNYVCDQLTTRYIQRSRSSGWEPLDVLTAKVVYEDGHEDYRDITVGGKKTNKSMMELGGTTSTGEFASTMHSLFSQQTNAEFKLYESTSVDGSAAAIYDFKVMLRRSDWLIKVGGQELLPAYSGSVWIDKSTGEVRRVEMQADNVPKDFPFDSIQMAVDYDKVHLGTSEFLLPVHSENLACQRGSPICTKNTIDFRDYHKYTGESTIEFK
ncbi:MAG TPA: hypothetical protein VHU83_17640 [Bryobacteraceae bacterium]|jgi:hypothetical protein|nr:hypothetical protein [Bryobacteraceae bacterium]